MYFPPDQVLHERAREKLRKLLFKECFMERWSPVQREMNWVLTGRPNEKHHKKILPAYCYNIFEIQRRTTYKAFSPLAEVLSIKNKRRARKAKTIAEAKKSIAIDWEKLGAVFAMGERCLYFFEHELEQKLKQGGLLKPKRTQELELYQILFGNEWLNHRIAEIQARRPGKPFAKVIEENFNSTEQTTNQAIPVWHQKAREWSPEAVTNFHAGITKGSKEFIDKLGELKGEKKLKLRNTYEFLLIAWPEIEEMIKANPPKTRNHLWEWLKPFSYARWIEIEDLEQLNRLCNEIELKLKKPGAPFKPK